MAEVMGIDPSSGSPREIAEKAILEMRKMVAYLEIPTTLSTFGIKKEKFEAYAKSVVTNQQRLITNGPRQLNEKDVVTIYERSY